jgi:alpha-galactosidase
MDTAFAHKILNAPADKLERLFKEANWYNSTELSYKDGLKRRDARLMGKKVGNIIPGGSLTAKVKRHSVEMYRLKSIAHGGKRKVHSKEEL